MPFNGSGGFNPLPAPTFPAVPNTVIASEYFNLTLQDVFAGLGAVVTRNGQSPFTGNIPAGGFKITGLGQPTILGDSLAFGRNATVADLVVTGVIRGLGVAYIVDHIVGLDAVALAIPDGQLIYARGRLAAYDRGGGFFRYVSGSVVADDGGTVITTTGGRFYRLGRDDAGFAGDVTPYTFGCKGDGATLDTAPMQAMLNSVAKRCVIEDGVFLCGGLTFTSNRKIIGAGGTIKAAPTTGTLLKSSDPNINTVLIEGITFDGTGLDHNVGVVSEASCIGCYPTSISDVTIRGNRFINIPVNLGASYHAVQISADGNVTVEGNYVQQSGGDILNFNGSDLVAIVTGNKLRNGKDGGVAMNNDCRGIVSDNDIQKCDLGVGVGPMGTTIAPDNDLQIIGNRISVCNYGIGMGSYGFSGREGPQKMVIANNVIRKTKNAAIRDDGTSLASYGLMVIQANNISYCGSTEYDGSPGEGRGIAIFNAQNTDILDNIFNDLTGEAIYTASAKNRIRGNQIRNAGGNAIYSEGDYAEITDNRVETSSADGIQSKGNFARVEQNTIISVLANGLHFTGGSASTTCLGNTLRTNATGIRYDSTAYNDTIRIGANTLIGNTVDVVNVRNSRSLETFVDYYFDGTTNGSGAATINHGLSGVASYQVVVASGFVKGPSNEAVPMTVTAVDGNSIFLTSAIASRPCRAYLRLAQQAASW